ncbi:hypothetical protein [Desulfosporosinus youngiae]|uniref:Uncharacterized protein n=1 Tax=Desulfosporosinus youngiae DSM 17734 TaxID=768710 RepID=H5XU73_9FIRM|nr:hypothetical protein [Desulfosporosinus youngiae]EHQ89169.1 hypothetical protein DesyoDRAFT_2075 [Desulfosporosinus youngiae DSM 17734]
MLFMFSDCLKKIRGVAIKKYSCLMFALILIITLTACTASNSQEKTNTKGETEPFSVISEGSDNVAQAEVLIFSSDDTDLIKLGTLAFDTYMDYCLSRKTPVEERIASYKLNDISVLSGDINEFYMEVNYDFTTDNDNYLDRVLNTQGKGIWRRYMEMRVKYAYDNVYSIAGIAGGDAQEITLVEFGQEAPTDIFSIINEVKSYFEETGNRVFDISFPVQIEGEDCYKIVVSGKLASSQTYPIDTFAVNLNGDKRYLLNKETDTYEKFQTIPTFACKTSPDGKLRIESVGMYMDGPSGLHALKEMRIINTSTCDVLWSRDSNLTNEFLWSEDSRFVTAGYAGRLWRQTDIVDTKDYSVIKIPIVDDILKTAPDISKPNDGYYITVFKATGWLNPSTVSIQFELRTNNDKVVFGEYEYDVINNKMVIKEINEESRG